jgi:hypothetical protein
MKRNLFYSVMLVFILVIGIMTIGCASVSTTLQDTNVPWKEQALVLATERPYYIESSNYGIMCSAEIRKPGSYAFAIKLNQVGVVPSGHHNFYVHVEGQKVGAGEARHVSKLPGIELSMDLEPGGRYVVHGILTDTGASAMVMTVDEYYEWWKQNGVAPMYKNVWTEDQFQDAFKKSVLSKFEKAEAKLR